MKKYRATIALLVIFAGLLGFYIYLNQEKPFEAATGIFRFEKDNIREIAISSRNGKIRFDKRTGSWVMIEPSSFKIDQRKLLFIEELLNNLDAVRVIARGTDDLDSYGLDKPDLSIEIKSKKGETRTLLVGAETASKTEYYARESAENYVYTVNKNDIDVFRGNSSDFRDRSLLTIYPAFIQDVTITAGSKIFKLIRDSDGKWGFLLPVKAKVKGDAVKELLEKIMGLQIQDFIVEKTDHPNEYGLDKPSSTLSIGDKNGKVQTVDFGNAAQNNRGVFIRVKGSDEVYTVPSSAFNPGNISIGELLNEAPLSIGIGEVNKIVIIDQERTVEFTRDASKPGDIFTIAQKPVNNEDFTTLYVNIMALVSEGYDPDNQGGAPELTVIFQLKENNSVKAEFLSRNDSSYFITINGKPLPFYVTARKVELVKIWLQRVCESAL